MTTKRIPLAEGVAANIRAEMGRRLRDVNGLALTLGVGRRAALLRYRGEHEYSLAEIEKISDWLDIDKHEIVSEKAA